MDWFLYDNGLRHERLMKLFDYLQMKMTKKNKLHVDAA